MPLIWKHQPREVYQGWIDVIMTEASDELNDWESSFLDSIQKHLYYGDLTESQAEKLESIYVEKCP